MHGAVMVLGCTSGAGKSWLATALCRWYARQGYRVAPFKAQNMSNHARVVAAGGGLGEIGSAQYFQALAAGVLPDVRMNPVLLKPESDTRSQVIVHGLVREDLAQQPWRERSEVLRQAAREAYAALRADYDLIVIEGAGSPAEINLASSDYVNTGMALFSEAACLLTVDIDRGGAFAHLYGTHRLMDAVVQRQLRGFVLNRFRGDPNLLAPAPEHLRALTGVPTVAVIPLVRDHGLPEEDAVPPGSIGGGYPHVVVLAAPHASNLDEFEPLRGAGARLTFARDAATIAAADWLIVPGSKQTRADLAWVRANGLHEAILAHIATSKPTLAVCGGLQMLGRWLGDPHGLEGSGAAGEPGLEVFAIDTDFHPQKRLSMTRARFAALEGCWAALSNLDVSGYEIRLGRSQSMHTPGLRPALVNRQSGEVLGWQQGSVLGIYLHGVFEVAAVLGALWHAPPPLELAFDRLADTIERSFAPGILESLAQPRVTSPRREGAFK